MNLDKLNEWLRNLDNDSKIGWAIIFSIWLMFFAMVIIILFNTSPQIDMK